MNRVASVPRIPMERMPDDLASALRPRVERLGYLGEFFQCAAHQPAALLSFMQFTDDLKDALPDALTEVVALTVASLVGNEYERNQHERLCRKLGFDDGWIRAVRAVDASAASPLVDSEKEVQRLTVAVVERHGHGVEAELAAVVERLGHAAAVAVLLLAGRYVTHALVVNSLGLAPPVASIFDGEGPGAGKARSQ